MSLKYEVEYDSEFKAMTYRRHGRFHRNNGPSNIRHRGTLFWYEYGISHRLDGPSDVYCNGVNYYCIRGIEYTKEEYEFKIRRGI